MKKAAPVKESGLQDMQPDINSLDMATHMDFGLQRLLPFVVGYAKSEGHRNEVALVASLLILATAAHANGVSRDHFHRMVDTACPALMTTPETVQ